MKIASLVAGDARAIKDTVKSASVSDSVTEKVAPAVAAAVTEAIDKGVPADLVNEAAARGLDGAIAPLAQPQARRGGDLEAADARIVEGRDIALRGRVVGLILNDELARRESLVEETRDRAAQQGNAVARHAQARDEGACLH